MMEIKLLKQECFNLPDYTDLKDALDIFIDLHAETQELELALSARNPSPCLLQPYNQEPHTDLVPVLFLLNSRSLKTERVSGHLSPKEINQAELWLINLGLRSIGTVKGHAFFLPIACGFVCIRFTLPSSHPHRQCQRSRDPLLPPACRFVSPLLLLRPV
ncbi:hypothetical protein TNCV_4904351 [Trichonephila clavipes]|nr:hypothetical protein TNCV_4904351 [Trichonephila clavipes]